MLLAGSHLAKRLGDQVSWEVDYDYLGIYPLGTNDGRSRKSFFDYYFLSHQQSYKEWRKSQKSFTFFPLSLSVAPRSESREDVEAVRRGKRDTSHQIWPPLRLPFCLSFGTPRLALDFSLPALSVMKE